MVKFSDPDSLKRVVKDVQLVFLMGTPFEDGTEGEIRRGKLMADIAKENNIEHILYSSVANADKNTGIPHFESKYKIEQQIKSLGIPHTIIGPTFFLENLLGPGLEQGQLAFLYGLGQIKTKVRKLEVLIISFCHLRI